jgi:hypothetical protein
MSGKDKKTKLLKKAEEAPDNVRWNELLNLMNEWEFKERKTMEGVCFPHPVLAKNGSMMPRGPKPHGDKVKQPYVKQCIKAIQLLIDLQKEEEK